MRFPLPATMEILLEKHALVPQFPPPHQPYPVPGLGQVLYMYYVRFSLQASWRRLAGSRLSPRSQRMRCWHQGRSGNSRKEAYKIPGFTVLGGGTLFPFCR